MIENKSIEELYKENRPHIEAVASKLSLASSFERDELISVGNEIFMECIEGFDPSCSQFQTYFSRFLEWGLYAYMRKERKRQEKEVLLEDLKWSRNNSKKITINEQDKTNYNKIHDNKILFDSIRESLSRDARMCIDIILDKEYRFDSKAGNKQIVSQAGLRRYLRKTYGWTVNRVQHSFNEIQVQFGFI